MKSVSITVVGKVQGVFFRKYTAQFAERLDLQGFVKNLLNGNVYIEVKGNEQEVNQLIAWCHEGSPMSQVSEVRVSQIDPSIIQEKIFKIAY